MICRWAPSNENNTEAYIKAVAQWLAIKPDSIVTSTDCDVMVPIVAAMSRIENGKAAEMKDVEDGGGISSSTLAFRGLPGQPERLPHHSIS